LNKIQFKRDSRL